MIHSLGITSVGSNIYLFSKVTEKRRKPVFQVATSSDGFNFQVHPDKPVIVDEKSGKEEPIKKCEDFRVAKLNGGYFLTYKRFTLGRRYKIYGAVSEDLVHWKKLGKLSKVDEPGALVPDYKYKGRHVIYFGEGSIKVAFSKSLKRWEVPKRPVLEPRADRFDKASLEVMSCKLTNDGIYLVYNVKGKNGVYQSVGAALFDRNEPTKVLWRLDEPIWTRRDKWKDKTIHPLGITEINGRPVSYWSIEDEGISAIVLPSIELQTKTVLESFAGNPIIEPINGNPWESIATFNPAAVYEGGKVHILYRSIGDNNTSVLGYASSKNGTHIDERLKEPAFVHSLPKGQRPKRAELEFIPLYSPRAGWCGGCEDPRITKIGDRFYMTFVSFDGRSPPRVALTSIRARDFMGKKWNWEKPVLISPPGVVDKNCVIFPEKVDGKYVIFHRIFPSILIDFVDDLEFDGETKFLRSLFTIDPREGMWDSRKLGAGPPPIKTKDGWLLIYQAVGDLDPNYRYCIGAMILDPNDPTKVLFRSNKPILEPGYGDANIAYPCGAAVIKKKLFVYYGSGDVTVKVASAELGRVVDSLKDTGEAKIMPINLLNF